MMDDGDEKDGACACCYSFGLCFFSFDESPGSSFSVSRAGLVLWFVEFLALVGKAWLTTAIRQLVFR